MAVAWPRVEEQRGHTQPGHPGWARDWVPGEGTGAQYLLERWRKTSRTAMACGTGLLANTSICVSASLVSRHCTDAEDMNCDDLFNPRWGRSGTTAHSTNKNHHSNTKNGQHFWRFTKHSPKLFIANPLLNYHTQKNYHYLLPLQVWNLDHRGIKLPQTRVLGRRMNPLSSPGRKGAGVLTE